MHDAAYKNTHRRRGWGWETDFSMVWKHALEKETHGCWFNWSFPYVLHSDSLWQGGCPRDQMSPHPSCTCPSTMPAPRQSVLIARPLLASLGFSVESPETPGHRPFLGGQADPWWHPTPQMAELLQSWAAVPALGEQPSHFHSSYRISV